MNPGVAIAELADALEIMRKASAAKYPKKEVDTKIKTARQIVMHAIRRALFYREHAYRKKIGR